MSLKLKLISVVALFTLMLGILIMGVFAATQSINLTGSLNFNIPDRSLYVKDIRIKQDLNEEPVFFGRLYARIFKLKLHLRFNKRNRNQHL